MTCWQRTPAAFDIHRLQLLRVVEGLDATATAIACFSSSLRRSPAAAISPRSPAARRRWFYQISRCIRAAPRRRWL